MYKEITLIFIVVSWLAPVQDGRNLQEYNFAMGQSMIRMKLLMRSIYVKLDERTTDLHSIRFSYEKSKEFEEGYIMSVIIEKYRQAVEHTKFAPIMKAFKTYDILLRVEMVQQIYLDLFRMVNMMHEIPRKYGFDIRKRKRSTVKGNAEEIIMAIKTLKSKELNRKKKRRLQLKELKRLREAMQQAGDNLTMTPRTPRNTKQWWDFQEYGWELADDYREEW